MLKHIPNALTLTRLILAPVIAWHAWVGVYISGYWEPVSQNTYDEEAASFTLAAVLFVIAALTDLFDGMAARAFNAHSKFGRIIDPIADKALVGLPLVAIVIAQWHGSFSNLPMNFQFVPIVTACVAVIVIRDVTMTWVRLSAPDGEGARVSSLAKIKTALELVVIGAYLISAVALIYVWPHVAAAGPDAIIAIRNLNSILDLVWIALLVITAALSAYTGWQYLRPAKKG